MTETSSDPLFTCVKYMVNVTGDEPVMSTEILESLSNSNNPPSPNELAILTGEYKAISRTLLSVDTEINLLQTKLQALKNKRQQLASSMGVYKFILNACRRLPNEILASIFELCVKKDAIEGRLLYSRLWGGAYSDANESPTLNTKRSPWVLGQVCHRWRSLVLSLPDLWTGIDISWAKQPGETHQLFIERRLSLTLQRSQGKPLYILWDARSCSDRAIASMLCSRSLQWKALFIATGIKGLRLLVPYGGAFPSLSSLHLEFTEDEWLEVNENNPIFSIFQDAPALRHVTLVGDDTVTRRLSRQIPWHQITQFTLEGGSWNEYFGSRGNWHDFQILLPHLTNVEELTLDNFEFKPSDSARPPLRLVKLHALHLSQTCRLADDSIAFLLNSLTLPSLRDLSIAPGWDTNQSIIELLDRSACRLEKFTISNMTNLELIDLLRAGQLQTVHDLCLVGREETDPEGYTYMSRVSDMVLDALKFLPPGKTTSRPNIFPHLTELTLDGECYEFWEKWSDKALVEILVSRRDIDQFPPGSVSRLERVWSYGNFVVWDADAVKQLSRLIEEGLIINNGDALAPFRIH
ncbi:hypothetical protein L218DRAFT_459716 [Marasmius fiardii PR-910]|nr:hypothetical protein L218DRAFT_459716 [Marasmius fiardii PR-910]